MKDRAMTAEAGLEAIADLAALVIGEVVAEMLLMTEIPLAPEAVKVKASSAMIEADHRWATLAIEAGLEEAVSVVIGVDLEEVVSVVIGVDLDRWFRW